MKKSLMMLIASVLTIPMYGAYGMDLGLGTKVGTLGVGVDLTASINPHLNARVGLNNYNYEYSGTESDVDYDFDFMFNSSPVLLDWHPMAGRFRFSAGILINQNEITLDAKPTGGTYVINGTTYNTSEIANLTGDITFDKSAAYLGIGFGNAVRSGTKLNLLFDLGIVFQGAPSVDYEVTGTLANDPTLRNNLEQEAKDLEDALSEFKYYPVIALGLNYKF